MHPQDKQYDEKVLIARIAAGDEYAFAELFHAWRDKLYFFLLKLGATTDTAEDILQDTFLKLWLHRGNLTEVNNINAYLYRMVRNRIYDLVQQVASEQSMISGLVEKDFLSSQQGDHILINKELSEIIMHTIESLPPQQREVFKMSRLAGYKQEEIAAVMQISVSTVKNHMTQALKTIKKKVSEQHIILLLVAAAFFRN